MAGRFANNISVLANGTSTDVQLTQQENVLVSSKTSYYKNQTLTTVLRTLMKGGDHENKNYQSDKKVIDLENIKDKYYNELSIEERNRHWLSPRTTAELIEYKCFYLNSEEVKILRWSFRKLMDMITYFKFDRFSILLLVLKRFVPTWHVHMLNLCYTSTNQLPIFNVDELINLKANWETILPHLTTISNQYKGGYNIPREWIELLALNGYQTLPVLGYSELEEVKAFANGGKYHHGLNSQDQFTEQFKHEIYKLLPPYQMLRTDQKESIYQIWALNGKKYKIIESFQDYVLYGDWEVNGSSDLGHGEFEVEKEQNVFMSIKLKLRKNLVLDFVSVEKILELVELYSKETAVAFTKTEFKRPRIVVGSDTITIILMKYIDQWSTPWMNELKNLAFRDTPEFLDAKVGEIRSYLKRGSSGCSFDYQGFERQPTFKEMEIVFEFLNSLCNLHNSETEMIKRKILLGYKNSYISVNEKGTTHTIKVTGGLPSGIAWTAKVGGLWSITTYNTVCSLAQIPKPQWSLNKGDDKVIFNDDNLSTLTQVASVLEFGIKAAPGKWSLAGLDSKGQIINKQNRVEFLRRIITEDEVFGYPARSIIHCLQFTPWARENNSIWNKQLGYLSSLITSLLRVGKNPRDYINYFFKPVNEKGINLLTKDGGMGLMINNQLKISVTKKSIVTPTVRVQLSNDRLKQLTWAFGGYKKDIDYRQLNNYLFSIKLLTSDYPPYKKQVRDQIKKQLSTAQLLSVEIRPASRVNIVEGKRGYQFSKRKDLTAEWERLSLVKRYSKEKFNIIDQLPKRDADLVKQISKRFRFNYGESIDWLGGKLPNSMLLVAHPNLVAKINNSTSYRLDKLNGFHRCRSQIQRVQRVNALLLACENQIYETYWKNYQW